MPYVDSVDGVKVYFEVLGEGEVPLILVPGLGSAEGKINYKHQLSFATNYPLVLIELPGHGRSGKDREKYTMELFGQDVKAVVDQLNLSNSILVGYSLGGAIIVEAAKLLGERVKGLICVDSLLLPGHLDQVNEETIRNLLQPFEEDFLPAWTNYVDVFFSDEISPEDTTLLRGIIPTLDQRSILSAFAELLRWNGTNALQQIHTPMKFIVAGRSMPEKKDRDHWVKIYDIEFLENVGHLLQFENPQAFNKLLEKRITELLG